MKFKQIANSFVFIALLLLLTGDSYAIPSFARKYQTSCTTCHVAFPKLNSFGEAFRLNGFIIPEADEDFVKEEPMLLGSEAYKRVWPNAVWPSTMPGVPPIAVGANSGYNYLKGEDVETEFTAPTVNVFLAGSFNESISFYTGLHLFDGGEIGSLGRAYIRFNNLLDGKIPKTRLYVRFGQFIPDAVPFANHRNLSLNSFALNTYYTGLGSSFPGGHAHEGEGGFNLESNQLGVEVTGIVASRFRFGAGLVNGNGSGGENNKAKDGYFRLAYKLGGMAFDGSSGGESGDELAQTDNWKELSMRIGVFGYKGGADNTGDVGPKDLKFHRYGADINMMLNNLNLFGGFLTGRDRTMNGSAPQDIDYNLFFLEGDYVVYPWLIGSVRYENVSPDGLDSFSRVIPHVTILARANVKFILESALNPDDLDFNNFRYMLTFAY